MKHAEQPAIRGLPIAPEQSVIFVLEPENFFLMQDRVIYVMMEEVHLPASWVMMVIVIPVVRPVALLQQQENVPNAVVCEPMMQVLESAHRHHKSAFAVKKNTPVIRQEVFLNGRA